MVFWRTHGLCQTVEKTFQAVLRQNQAKVLASFLSEVKRSLAEGGRKKMLKLGATNDYAARVHEDVADIIRRV
jgi:hypothetical protein